MMRRIKDFRRGYAYNVTEPVASNFYPMNFAIAIRQRYLTRQYYDNDYKNFHAKDKILALYGDRPQSSGTMNTGEMMVIMNRRSIRDDARGVDEPIFEKSSNAMYFRVLHYISATPADQKTIFDLIHYRPTYLNVNSLTGTLDKAALVPQLIQTDCVTNIQILDAQNFFIQVLNRNDPFFDTKSVNCTYTFKTVKGLNYSVTDVDKSGADPISSIASLKFLGDNIVPDFARMKSALEATPIPFDVPQTLVPQEFKLNLVKLN